MSLDSPRISNDNPYSEAQFKTVKYHPGFPGRFGSIEEAKDFCREFFSWYNTEDRHGGIGLLTPGQVHFGPGSRGDQAPAGGARCRLRRPARPLRRGTARVAELAAEVWINRPIPVSAVDGREAAAEGSGANGKEGSLN